MTVNRTTLLDLPLPVTGTESGTWGDTTNNGLTQYMDIAIAGMSNLTSANFTTGALTIETTEGDSTATNISATSAQYAGFRVTSLAQNSTITVGNTGTSPARSYRLINADATYTLTFKATGQTGITLQPGQTAVVAFNGTDYVIVGMAGAGTVTDNAIVRFDGTTGKLVQNSVVTIADSTGDISGVGQLNATTVDTTSIEVTNIKAKDGTAAATIADSTGVVTVTAAPVMTALTASQAVFTTAGKALASNAITGTGNVVMSASPTLTGTVSAAAATLSGNLTLSGGTANGVLYLDGSKVATSGSALTFDGTNLGVGTSSPASQIHINGNADNYFTAGLRVNRYTTTGQYVSINYVNGVANIVATDTALSSPAIRFLTSTDGSTATEQMRLTSTGLGIGTSSPTSKLYVTASVASTAIAAFFNTDTANGNGVYIKAGGANAGKYALVIDNAASSSLLYLDASGNLGLGVTPSAWSASAKVIQIGSYSNIYELSGNTSFGNNFYYNGTNSLYLNSTQASIYQQSSGQHRWYTAPSGTAGNAITFTQAMTLDASGNLVIGDTSGTARLEVKAVGVMGRFKTGAAADGRVEWAYNTTDIGYIGADTSTEFSVFARSGNVLKLGAGGTERARITSGGDLQISSGGSFQVGGTAARATTAGTNRIDIFNGTAPVGTLTNGISLYSSSGEAYVMDAAGNATLFSPHDAETNEWVFKSKHTPTGKVLKIDVEKLLRFVNDHFGLDAVHEFVES